MVNPFSAVEEGRASFLLSADVLTF